MYFRHPRKAEPEKPLVNNRPAVTAHVEAAKLAAENRASACRELAATIPAAIARHIKKNPNDWCTVATLSRVENNLHAALRALGGA